MRVRSFFMLLTAMALSAPMAATAVMITVSIDGFSVSGLGRCDFAGDLTPGHAATHPHPACTDLINIPPNGDGGGPFDYLTLDPKSDTADYTLPDTVTFLQDFVFNPGDTGAGSLGFIDFFSLARNVTVTEIGFAPITLMLTQTGNLLVGLLEDDLTIDPSDTLVFHLNSGDLTVKLGGAFLRAGIDPPGQIEVQVDLTPTAVPVPSTLALFGLGLAGIAIRRRRQTA